MSFRRNLTLTVSKLLVLLVIQSATAFCLNGNSPTQPGPGACPYSDQIYGGDSSLMLREPPTHFELMTSRYVGMVQAARGYQCSGTVTVGFDGHNFFETGRSEDAGMMELIPTVARLIGMSLAKTYDLTIL